MYSVCGLPPFPIQYVSVRAAREASRSSVVSTDAPSGTLAMAALAAATCGLISYVCPFHRLLIGYWNASGTVIASIMAGPWRSALASVARHQPHCPAAQPGPPDWASGWAVSSALLATVIEASAATAAMNRIGITVAL